MKKILIILLVLMGCIVGFAQLIELRGVETKWVDDGYSFYNMNSISVSIDAELYNSSQTLINTKSFTIKSKETYIWKITKPSGGYVKYKAYKIL